MGYEPMIRYDESGSFDTTTCQTDYGDICLRFEWELEYQNASGSIGSGISWSVKGDGGRYGNLFVAKYLKVVINGKTVYDRHGTIGFTDGEVLASGNIDILHNSDGTKNFSASVEATLTDNEQDSSGSNSWNLPTIPVYARLTQFRFVGAAETMAKFSWETDATCDLVEYTLDQTNYYVASGYPEFTIAGLQPNTTYAIGIRVRHATSQLYTYSHIVPFSTYDYPYCTSANDFVLGDKTTLTFYNPLSRPFTFYIIATDGNDEMEIPIALSCSGTTYEGLDDENLVDALYSFIPTHLAGFYKVKVVYDVSTKLYWNNSQYSIKESECIPDFSDFIFKNENDVFLNLIENDQILVKGQTGAWVYVPAESQMVTKRHATPNRYVITIDDTVDNVPGDTLVNTGAEISAITTAGLRVLTVRAYDSRGLSKAMGKPVEVLDYEKPLVSVEAKRRNGFESETTLAISGEYSMLATDGRIRNTVKKVECRYREIDGEWSNVDTIGYVIDNSKFSCYNTALILDHNKNFELEISVYDKVTVTTVNVIVESGQAMFFMCSNKKAFFVDGKPALVGADETDTAPVSDYPIESGVDGIWIWEKRKSGVVIMYGMVTVPYATTNVLEAAGITFPFELIENGIGFVSINEWESGSDNTPKIPRILCKTNRCSVQVLNHLGTYTTDSTVDVAIKVIGKWK